MYSARKLQTRLPSAFPSLLVQLDGNTCFRPVVFPQSLQDFIKATNNSIVTVDWGKQTSRLVSIMVLLLIQVSYDLILNTSVISVHTYNITVQHGSTFKVMCLATLPPPPKKNKQIKQLNNH